MDFPVNTFGYGSDHNAGMLSNLANSLGGSYYYIEGQKTVASVLAVTTAGLMTTVTATQTDRKSRPRNRADRQHSTQADK